MRPLDFVTAQLRMNPEATFEEVHARGKLEQLVIHRTVYGRAKARLGLSTPRRRQVSEAPSNPDSGRHTGAQAPANTSPENRHFLLEDLDIPESVSTMIQELRQAIVERDRYLVIAETILALCEEGLAE